MKKKTLFKKCLLIQIVLYRVCNFQISGMMTSVFNVSPKSFHAFFLNSVYSSFWFISFCFLSCIYKCLPSSSSLPLTLVPLLSDICKHCMEFIHFLIISLIFPSVTVVYSVVQISGFPPQPVQTHTARQCVHHVTGSQVESVQYPLIDRKGKSV